ncbi:Putative methyltransferase [Croceitalea dokdonensis DOKDO 023]|uniref:Putative methyltransferase n=1 Tax=Croceitalea dokdonensis DOKDO 023 TaxID=1300341 RepID=A0A0P7ABB5_9FLAO|nr:RsmD family RNA methyltransferase [Croceitalea dokdonensis]KPM30414.1 Putative methyltransferase [Croceitalea dokdonensis DOKDO 023]
MRIISGKNRGKRIIAPKKLPVRPTTDMAKEGLFNILNNRYRFEDVKVLDMFAGTGNISYEFGSRGTKDITAVDASAPCASFIIKTSKALDLDINVKRMDCFKYLERTRERFDIIFADPPYHLDVSVFSKIPELVFEHNRLQKDGLLIIEHADRMNLEHLKHFHVQRKYGSSIFSFFQELD